VHEALAKAEFVVLQDCFTDTETATYADLILPATTWGEKDGTVTNSERRISRVRPAIPTPFEAKHDWHIVVDFAQALEKKLDKAQSIFNYPTSESVWLEHRESTRGRDLDITGMSYDMLERSGPQQWPLVEGESQGRARLYADGIYPTASGKAKFVLTPFKPVAEPTDARYPLRLTTGRLRDQWHCMSRTGKVAQLYAHAPEPTLELNGTDLARKQLKVGDLARVISRRGEVIVRVSESDGLKPGVAYLPMHWGKRYLGGKQSFGVNTITVPTFDAFSKQPELKHTAVRVEKAELPYRLTAFGYPTDGDALSLLERLQSIQEAFEFFSATLIGRDEDGVLLRAASSEKAPTEILTQIDAAFGLDQVQTIRYDDARKNVGRRVLLRQQTQGASLAAVRLSGELTDVAAEPWLRDWLTRNELVEPIRRLLMLPSATPPNGYVEQGKVICSCWNVTQTAIDASLEAMNAAPAEIMLAQLQGQLKCGTNCGSCVPELKRCVQTRCDGRALSA
jgi:assimilatory nitrate reductase catalytic subunit